LYVNVLLLKNSEHLRKVSLMLKLCKHSILVNNTDTDGPYETEALAKLNGQRAKHHSPPLKILANVSINNHTIIIFVFDYFANLFDDLMFTF